MRIAVDTFILDRAFRNQGSYVYARKILEEFEKRTQPSDPRFQLLVSSSTSSDAHQFDSREGFELVESGLIERKKLWRMGMSSFTVGRRKADLAYFPAPVNCIFSQVPTVVTVYDATIITSPSQTLIKRGFERTIIWNAMRSASKILTLSNTSKDDLSQLYGVSPERIAVVYLGYDQNMFREIVEQSLGDGHAPETLGIHKPYILHHGVIQPRKNLERLIEAYQLALDRHPSLDFDLALVGPTGWRSEGVLRAANQASKRGRVVLTGPVSDRQLASLIRHASLCVIPSLYEGFCLPLLECMACGSPTIASRASCLPEVSGGVLRYFDPYSVEEMCEGITDALCDAGLRRDLIASGLRRAKEFSWQRCADETLRVLIETGTKSRAN